MKKVGSGVEVHCSIEQLLVVVVGLGLGLGLGWVFGDYYLFIINY